ncbi:MAG: TadE family type IV pilus minor pilin [Acidimicrobiales bacterium]
MTRRRPDQQGQATVELVLALPVVLVSLLLLMQIALVVRAQVLVVDAAREGARAAAVGDSAVTAARATPGLGSERLTVEVHRSGPQMVEVTVRYRAPTDVALVGLLVADPRLTATVAMRVEDP